MHIMLCSKSVELVDAASKAFSAGEYHLTVCECGLEALGVVEVMDADLLILDLDTPGLDSLLIVAAVRELAPTLPIVAVSTKPQVDARAVSHRGVSYVTLPPGSTREIQCLLVGFTQTERIRLPSDAESTH